MDITCGRLDIKDIIACSLSLKKSEYKIFEVLLKSKENLTIQQLSDKLKLDRTTIQKILKVLTSKGLILRYQQNLENGGYIFNYTIKNKLEVKNFIKSALKAWYEASMQQIDKC
jgi:predicted transcriptional regulator